MSHDQPTGVDPGPGAVLSGRYRLEQRVGRGGMADVYRGTDELLHRTVAVKLFRFDAAEETERHRIAAEMRTLAGLRHPGLVTLFDASAAGDAASGEAPFLVMEFIEGETLRERIAVGPLPPAEVATLGAELAASLRYVHSNGIVHRDVKPANILLDEPRTGAPASAKLTDFGIARLTEATRLTMEGTTVGTANYLSPEQAQGQPVGPASDVYSLGLVLLECLTGRLAYPGAGVPAALARLHRPPDIPVQFGPDWVQLFTAMTQLAPQARPDAGHVIDALVALSAETAPMPATTTALGPVAAPHVATSVLPATGVVRGSRRRLTYVISALVAAALLAAVLVISLSSASGGGDGPGPPPTYPSVPGQLGRHLDILEGVLS